MDDFEVHPVGTEKLIRTLKRRVRIQEIEDRLLINPRPDPVFTDEEKSDMYWESNTADGIAPDEDLPIFLKKQAD